MKTARTTAWALTYFLARHRLDNLERYFHELASLPRDLEFDAAVLQGCFARAFDLVDRSDPTKLDMGKVTKLANDWSAAMKQEALDIIDVQNDALKERSKIKTRQPQQARQPRQPRQPNPNAPFPGTRPPPGFGPPPGMRAAHPPRGEAAR